VFAEVQTVSDGKPLEWPVAKIIPGDNPRKNFQKPETIAYIAELSEQIATRGVKSPISLQPATAEEVSAYFNALGQGLPESLDDFAKINHGECRWRASVPAKRETIPAFIDTQHDGYDALSENILRRDLDPLDIALYIQRYVDQGEKKSVIAKMIGKSASYVSNHLKLLALPEPIAEMVKTGKSNDVTALNLLGSAFAEYPEQVTEFCLQADEFTQSQVRKFVSDLASPPQAPSPAASGGADEMRDGSPLTGQALSAPEAPGAGDIQQSSSSAGGDSPGSGDPAPLAGASATPAPATGASTKAPKNRVTAIEIRHDDRPARLLRKVPTEAGLAWIKYEEDGHETEIPADTIQQVVSVAVE
jgi:ParB family chromosome partitioning protein